MRKVKRPLIASLDGLPNEFILTTHDVALITDSSADKVGEMLATGEIPGMFRFEAATALPPATCVSISRSSAWAYTATRGTISQVVAVNARERKARRSATRRLLAPSPSRDRLRSARL